MPRDDCVGGVENAAAPSRVVHLFTNTIAVADRRQYRPMVGQDAIVDATRPGSSEPFSTVPSKPGRLLR